LSNYLSSSFHHLLPLAAATAAAVAVLTNHLVQLAVLYDNGAKLSLSSPASHLPIQCFFSLINALYAVSPCPSLPPTSFFATAV
jgi:hypothetical protein